MKQCPACRSQYSDDTLQFCLQDGTPLAPVAEREIETVVVPRPTVERAVEQVPAPKRRTGLIVFVTALATMLIFGVIGIGYLMYSRGRTQNASRENINISVNANGQQGARPSVSPTVSPTLTPSPTATPADGPEFAAVAKDVTKAVAGWESDTEALDIDALAARYDDRVDYYRNPGVGRDFVLRDKDRAFSIYDSVNFEISNIKITPGKTPDTAIAEFDKEWDFEGEARSTGKVRSRLTMRKAGGKWLITGEHDVKIYR